MRTKLFFLSVLFALLFTLFSYDVAKEKWQKIDFDTTVKLQDHINPERSQKVDGIFSYLSLMGSAEVTVGACLLMAFLALIRRRWLSIIGWMMIVPASAAEIFGKLVLFHPGPPVFFHRTLTPTTLPSFYIHTDFSYPSGHMTRTIFILTILVLLVIFSKRPFSLKILIFGFILTIGVLMGMTRIYLGEHWMSDVIGGVLLGLASGVFASVLILRIQKV